MTMLLVGHMMDRVRDVNNVEGTLGDIECLAGLDDAGDLHAMQLPEHHCAIDHPWRDVHGGYFRSAKREIHG